MHPPAVCHSNGSKVSPVYTYQGISSRQAFFSTELLMWAHHAPLSDRHPNITDPRSHISPRHCTLGTHPLLYLPIFHGLTTGCPNFHFDWRIPQARRLCGLPSRALHAFILVPSDSPRYTISYTCFHEGKKGCQRWPPEDGSPRTYAHVLSSWLTTQKFTCFVLVKLSIEQI